MKNSPPRPTFAVVSLEAIQHNLTLYRAHTHTPIMAVVKANAYGHGAVPVARAAAEAGINWLGVAFAGEGLALRSAGLAGDILVMGYTPSHLAGEAVEQGLSLAVYDEDLAAEYARIAASRGLRVRLHVKVDTGMGRIGVDPAEAQRLVCRIQEMKGAVVEGVFTHFATADETDTGFARLQLSRFSDLVEALEASGRRPPLVHAANSAAALRYPEARFDLVRMGIAIYGLHPSGETLLPEGARPALEWKTTISQVRWMEPGTPVSYGRTYTTKEKELVAALPVGYADGFRRYSLQPPAVLVHGVRVPVVGRVCMDQMMVDASAVENIRIGDEVVMIGRQGEEHIAAEEVAGWWGTINYEVTCGIMARVPKIYE
jgi:alanine racemase